jgi:rhamnosyl/mannosyltransferase
MRILVFYKTALPDYLGGVEQIIHQLARGACKHGVQTDVLSLSDQSKPGMIEMDGYRVHRAPLHFEIASTSFSFSVISRFKQLAQKADIIHYHYPWPFMDLIHFFSRIKKPTIVSYQADIVRQKNLLKIYKSLQNKFLSHVNWIVANSPHYLSTSKVLAKYTNKITTIPIGLDKASYPIPKPERLQYWKEFLGSKFFLFIGVLRYYKGLHILLDAASGTDFPIVILGSGAEEEKLKQQAEKLKLKNVHFLGRLSDEDKTALLTLCYALVFPSHLRSESFGISLLEGAMYGKPLISCEIGTGTTFINIAKETGLVIPPNDPTALKNAMQYLWDNPECAAKMGQKAEERYWNYFTADQMVESYINLYQNLLKKTS